MNTILIIEIKVQNQRLPINLNYLEFMNKIHTQKFVSSYKNYLEAFTAMPWLVELLKISILMVFHFSIDFVYFINVPVYKLQWLSTICFTWFGISNQNIDGYKIFEIEKILYLRIKIMTTHRYYTTEEKVWCPHKLIIFYSVLQCVSTYQAYLGPK